MTRTHRRAERAWSFLLATFRGIIFQRAAGTGTERQLMGRKVKTTHFSVGRDSDGGVFKTIKAGSTTFQVMNKRVYEQATQKADEKIREYTTVKRAS